MHKQEKKDESNILKAVLNKKEGYLSYIIEKEKMTTFPVKRIYAGKFVTYKIADYSLSKINGSPYIKEEDITIVS
jgi:hypothetical protein